MPRGMPLSFLRAGMLCFQLNLLFPDKTNNDLFSRVISYFILLSFSKTMIALEFKLRLTMTSANNILLSICDEIP